MATWSRMHGRRSRVQRLYELQARLADLHERETRHFPRPFHPPPEELDGIFANPFADKGADEAAAVIAAAAAVAPPEELGAYRESVRIRTEAFHRQFINGMACVMACIEVSTNDTLHEMKRAARVTGAEELVVQARYYQKIVRTMRSDHGSNRRGRERRRAKRKDAVRLAKGQSSRPVKQNLQRPRVEENERLRRLAGREEERSRAVASEPPSTAETCSPESSSKEN
jgi:hypothetical protein